MALVQHTQHDVRFRQQVDNAREYLLPFIQAVMPVRSGMRIMEIGCGEGGVLVPFLELGAVCTGVDLSPTRIASAATSLAAYVETGQAQCLVQDVLDPAFSEAYRGSLDLIILKDTIEHIPGQETFIPHLKGFLKPGGHVFFGFPPWRMPFGGHQQICRSKWLGMTPWFHLLPRPVYAGVLRGLGESAQTVADLLEIQETGISLDRFERIIRDTGYVISARTLFLINPIYRYKFGLRPRVQARWMAAIPWLRDFFTTAGWYMVKPR
ncbi:MAG: class I SAM-dependent methyltransferase [Bacteroidia bacterium]|nr:class I SAM-dependent methyltransferase [Bacteroidia bacterium]